MLTADDARERTAGQALDTLAPIREALASAGTTEEACVALVSAVTEQRHTRQPLADIRDALAGRGVDVGQGAFERFLLTATARRSRERLDAQPVAAAVKAFCRDAFDGFASPRRPFDLWHGSFPALCKVASLRRYPAGQFDWEPSGLPRSWIPLIRPVSALVRTLAWVGSPPTRGFGPVFFIHMGTRGRNYALIELVALRSYHRMAQSLALQPRIKGLLASSWLHSPDTFAVSPHLAWLNRVFLEHGAIVGTMGPADPGCGVLHRSPERRRAHEEGRFRPTLGLVIWPRDAMLAWARAHPELESSS
jgi:hypothetical protein